MTRRRKALIGSMALLVYSFFYFLVVTGIAMMRLPDVALPWHLLYYFVATVIWTIPCGWVIRWVQRR